MKKFISSLLLSILLLATHAQLSTRVKAYRVGHERDLLLTYKSFLEIPNIASDQMGIKKNADWIAALMKEKGISNVQLLNPITNGMPPAVYGEVMTPGANETIILYAHYDGQPVDSSKWMKGLHPFKPQLANGSLINQATIVDWKNLGETIDPNWRIYGRGASDDKAGVFSIINAYGILKQLGVKPTVNIKFFFEGEEEAGSPHLHEIFEKYEQLLKGDMWVICDGPVHQSGRKQVVFGVRGDTHMELTVYGPKRPLHSGHYGNWIPNPAMDLAKLLASMKDDEGNVLVKGFYDDVVPLTAAEKNALAKVPPVEEQMKKELGVKKPERNSTLNESLNLPSLNINGIQSAAVGSLSANVIPTKAVASIDLRLVVGNDWKKQQQKVVAHIQSKGYHVVYSEPTDEERMQHDKICMVHLSSGYNAQKTPMEHAFAKRVVNAVNLAIGYEAVQLPTLGGSLPLFIFEEKLHAQPITIPIANHDNNQHAENENIRIGNLWDALEIFTSIMTIGK
ncbi:MAG: hypothetical protein RI965_659 [Bacteroidota bacterium]